MVLRVGPCFGEFSEHLEEHHIEAMVAYLLRCEFYIIKSNSVSGFYGFTASYCPPFSVQGAVIATNSTEDLQSNVISIMTREPTLNAFASNRSWQQVLREKLFLDRRPTHTMSKRSVHIL